jgi:hypothetical protein
MLSTSFAKYPMARISICSGFRNPESKRQYPRRIKMFFDFLGFRGTLEEHAKESLRNAKQNPK